MLSSKLQLTLRDRKVLAALCALIFLVASVSTIIGYQLGTKAQSSALTMQTNSGGVYPGAISYTVWSEGGITYSKDAYGSSSSSTNGATILQAAINNSPINGKIVVANNIVLPTKITIASPLTLSGLSMTYSPTITCVLDGFLITSSSVTFQNIMVQSQGLTKQYTGIDYSASSGLISYGNLDSVYLEGWKYALKLSDATSMNINNIHTNSSLISFYALRATTNIHVTNSFLTGHNNAAGSYGVYANSLVDGAVTGEGIDFVDTLIYGAETAVYDVNRHHDSFERTLFDTYTNYGMYAENVTDLGITARSYIGSGISGATGVFLKHSVYASISDCYIANPQYNIEVENQYYTTITGNVFDGSPLDDIHAVNTFIGATISGNTAHYTATTTNFLYIPAVGGDGTNVTVSGNFIEPPLTFTLPNDRTKHPSISGNTGFVTESWGQTTVSGGGHYPHGLSAPSGTGVYVLATLAGNSTGDTYPIVAVSAVTATDFYIRLRYQNGTGMDPVSIFWQAKFIP